MDMGIPRRERIEAYLDRLFGYAFSLTKDRERAQDLVQTCALKSLSAQRIPIDEAAYRAWLFKILRNTFLDELRKQPDNAVSLDDDDRGDGEAGRAVRAASPRPSPPGGIAGLTSRPSCSRLHRELKQIQAYVLGAAATPLQRHLPGVRHDPIMRAVE